MKTKFELKGDGDKIAKVCEKGLYKDAAEKGKSFGEFVEEVIQTEEGGSFEPTEYAEMSPLEKFEAKKAYTQRGEVAPPDAYEIMLKAMDIRTAGPSCDTVSKFFQSSSAAILYPWFIMNEVHSGSLAKAIWQNFVAVTTRIDGLAFKKIYLQDAAGDRQAGRSTRGAHPRRVSAAVAEHEINLEKYAVELDFEYETFLASPLNTHAVYLRKIGEQMGVDETDDLFWVMSAGDGNSNTGLESAQTKDATTSGAISKLDIITFGNSCPMPYQLTKFAGPTNYMNLFWDTLSDMTNPPGQRGEIGIPLPVGYRWDSGYFLITTDRFLGVDPSAAMGYVTNDSLNMTEQDRIIDRQTVKTVISKRGNFYNLEQDAIGALDIIP